MVNRRKPTPILDLYKDSSDGNCEIARWLGVTLGQQGFQRHSIPWGEPAAAVHHLFSVSGQRMDVWSNLLAISGAIHDADHFGTRGEPVIVRLLCIAAKSEKARATGSPSELVLEDLDRCAGKSVFGWLETQSLQEEWICKIQRDALRRLRVLAQETA
jgi:hypothetical protein